MYKVQKVVDGWVILDGSTYIDGAQVYPQRQAAYRQVKLLNRLCSVEGCTEIHDIECKIGFCAPSTLYCSYHYEQAHLPEDERD